MSIKFDLQTCLTLLSTFGRDIFEHEIDDKNALNHQFLQLAIFLFGKKQQVVSCWKTCSDQDSSGQQAEGEEDENAKREKCQISF